MRRLWFIVALLVGLSVQAKAQTVVGAASTTTPLAAGATFTGAATDVSAYDSVTETVNTGITGYRAHTMSLQSGSATAFNVGTVTLRHRTTTANVFLVMQIGTAQTNCSCYTVPQGKTAYLQQITGSILGNASNTMDVSLWVRTNGLSPRLRRPMTFSLTTTVIPIWGGLVITQGTDMILRVTASSGNGLSVTGGYDLVVVDN